MNFNHCFYIVFNLHIKYKIFVFLNYKKKSKKKIFSSISIIIEVYISFRIYINEYYDFNMI